MSHKLGPRLSSSPVPFRPVGFQLVSSLAGASASSDVACCSQNLQVEKDVEVSAECSAGTPILPNSSALSHDLFASSGDKSVPSSAVADSTERFTVEARSMYKNNLPPTKEMATEALIASLRTELQAALSDAEELRADNARLRRESRLRLNELGLSFSPASQSLIAALRLELQAAVSAAERLRADNAKLLTESRSKWNAIRVTSALSTDPGVWVRLAWGSNEDKRYWSSRCPVCKRPLNVTAWGGYSQWRDWPQSSDLAYSFQLPPTDSAATEMKVMSGCEGGLPEVLRTEDQWVPRSLTFPITGRYAYAACLWGSNPGFALGALVLGHSLRRRGATEDLVLLHTGDVPQSTRKLLKQIWILKEVSYIDAAAGLFSCKGGRFDGVFTKLHVLGLVAYEKVLMLDLDLAILKCPKALFELRPPAAMHRSVFGKLHGSRVDGSRFFTGATVEDSSDVQPWSQCGGINAGVMLLQPDLEVYHRALHEVTVDAHPERIAGSGPEQDYISRLYAPWWTNVGVEWNYQLHRVFHSLEGVLQYLADLPQNVQGDARDTAQQCLPHRLQLDVDDLCIIHYSGELKLWDINFLTHADDVQIASEILWNCSEWQIRLWERKEGSFSDYHAYGVALRNSEFHATTEKALCRDLIDRAVKLANGAALRATQQFREDLLSLSTSPAGLPPLSDLLQQLYNPSWPENARFAMGARVQTWHSRSASGYKGTVVGVFLDADIYWVRYDEEAGLSGSVAHRVWSSKLWPVDADVELV